jgi:GNAT superfamily N-acetyltransferase
MIVSASRRDSRDLTDPGRIRGLRMQVTVRRATAGDAAALAGLRLAALAEGSGYAAPDGVGFMALFSAWVRDHLSTHLPFVAELDDAVVGMAWLMVAERVPSPERRYRRSGDVQSVYVLPELRDREIGAALLEVVLAEAGRLELEHVTVHSSDRAVRLYQRVGFQHDQRWLRWEPE